MQEQGTCSMASAQVCVGAEGSPSGALPSLHNPSRGSWDLRAAHLPQFRVASWGMKSGYHGVQREEQGLLCN